MILCIFQARVGSERLKKKILKKIYGKTILEHQLLRFARSKMITKLVVATTKNKNDDITEKIASDLGYDVFRGDTTNVLKRYIDCAKLYKAKTIVRACGDDPLIDIEIIDQMIKIQKKNNYDFVSNVVNRTFPLGLDSTILKTEILNKIPTLTKDKFHYENVVTYLEHEYKKFNYFFYDKPKDRYSGMRWTLDYEEDFKFIKKIYSLLYKNKPDFNFKDVLEVIDEYKIKGNY